MSAETVPTQQSPARGYPPAVHFLRDLGLSVGAHGDGGCLALLPVVDNLRTVDGAVQPGILALLVDSVGGSLSFRAAAPDQVATTDLTLHCWQSSPQGPVAASGVVLRHGRNNLVIEVALSDGLDAGATSLGRATMTFSVRPRRPDNRVIGGLHGAWPPPGPVPPSLVGPILDQIGIEIIDRAEGRLRIELREYVTNSFDALNGGVVATLADVSASTAASAALGRHALTRQLTLHYLAAGRAGPITARSQILGQIDRSLVVRVEMADAGAEDRVTAVATVLASPA